MTTSMSKTIEILNKFNERLDSMTQEEFDREWKEITASGIRNNGPTLDQFIEYLNASISEYYAEQTSTEALSGEGITCGLPGSETAGGNIQTQLEW